MEPYQGSLPEGWVGELSTTYGLILSRPQGGCATVDFEKRDFALGITVVRRKIGVPPYSGKGWRDRLVAAAVAALEKAMTREVSP